MMLLRGERSLFLHDAQLRVSCSKAPPMHICVKRCGIALGGLVRDRSHLTASVAGGY